ncbi:hypothetical protein OH540_09270 [Streptomyces sp. BPPL-273]|nr:hypothetical protein [Streptomyces sp. BPPL-273]WHM30211.1 hypothetical protein OH540_09270 [Streptomyces sp. BPPL-273]
MTWLDVALYGPGWAAFLLIPVNWWLDRRFRRKYEARWGVPYRQEDFR